MCKLFGSVSKIDYHNIFRHSYLSLKKLWVDQCGCLQLFTSVATGNYLPNLWIKMELREKTMEKKSELYSRYLLQNPFPADTGTQAKNIPLLDVLDDENTVATH